MEWDKDDELELQKKLADLEAKRAHDDLTREYATLSSALTPGYDTARFITSVCFYLSVPVIWGFFIYDSTQPHPMMSLGFTIFLGWLPALAIAAFAAPFVMFFLF